MKRKYEFKNLSPLQQRNNSHPSFWNKKTWSHVELGAANYGENTYADNTHIPKKRKPDEKQHSILFKTVDELIENKGRNGIIYVNDLDEKSVTYTVNQLKDYIVKQYPKSNIKLKPLSGDFFKIDIPKVNSIHLKNPEFYLFNSLAGENQTRLKYFAEQSKEGLIFSTYYVKRFFEKVDGLGVGFKILKYKDNPYIHADGQVIMGLGNVVKFSIKSLDNLSGRLRSHSSKIMDEATITKLGFI